MTPHERPVPVPDDVSKPFWEASANDVLAIARCSRCQTFAHPPDSVCAACGSTDPGFTFSPVSGRGFVRSWTVVRQSFLPGFDDLVPYVLVDVALEEDDAVRLVGRLVDGQDATLAIGAPVRVVFEAVDDEKVPAFALVGS